MTHYSKIFIVAAVVLNAGWSASHPAMAEAFDDEHSSIRNVTRSDRSSLLTAIVGTTSDSGTTELTLGIEYERRLGKLFGVGVLAEHAFGALDSSVYALPVGISVGSSKLYIAPGIEDTHTTSYAEDFQYVNESKGKYTPIYNCARQIGDASNRCGRVRLASICNCVQGS